MPARKGMRIVVSNEDWNLLFYLCEAAKMDWFYEEFYQRKTITKECLEDASNAFLKENFWKFTDDELLRLYELFITHGVTDDFMRNELIEWFNRDKTKED